MTYDYIIIGSGFGGSVSAMRLSEKGYKCLVIEKGKRFKQADFPTSDWQASKYLWLPALRLFGLMKLTFFKEVFVISGTGVGGGSLIYANTHIFPPDAFFNNPVWAKYKNWKEVLTPFYAKARFMLGSTKVTKIQKEDEILREIAQDMGRGDTFEMVDVGVYFGDTKTEKDPYFNGNGPLRQGCMECSACMTGCRFNAKNTLDKNYLYFAEKWGTEVQAETLATKVEYIDGEYLVHLESSTGSFWNKQKRVVKAKGLVVSGGVLGTMDLLLKQKHHYGTMPHLSDTLGENLRTNSESIAGLINANVNLNHGPAITSVFNADDDTHIEVVKYGTQAGLITKLASLSTDGYSSWARRWHFLKKIVTQPFTFLKVTAQPYFGANSLILLVMQSLDNALKMEWKKGLFGGKIRFAKNGASVPAYIPTGQDVLYRYAEKVGGIPLNSAPETFFNMSTTAHILGGCPMGETAKTGVVNQFFQVNNYPNMYILDGSIIPCNLGVNPSLSITALSEYAMSHVPEKEGNTQISLEKMMAKNG